MISEAAARNVCVHVDARWLLLYCSLCGTVPSQASRFLGVSKWIEYFYHTCIPDHMVCSNWLFTGLPSPVMDYGLLLVPHRKSGRKTLRRPWNGDKLEQVGIDAPIRTGVVEDLGPAALRYQLAQVLKVCERSIPTDAVSYSFPVDQWCPVWTEGVFGSLKWDIQGRFVLKMPGERPRIISAKDNDDVPSFLKGRVSVDVRPLCMFDRGGVAVMLLTGIVGVLTGYSERDGGYTATTGTGVDLILNPYETEDAIIPVYGDLFLSTDGFPQQELFRFLMDEDALQDEVHIIISSSSCHYFMIIFIQKGPTFFGVGG